MAKSKKERRSSIRHMAAEDAFGVLDALQRAEQEHQASVPADESGDDADDGADRETEERPT